MPAKFYADAEKGAGHGVIVVSPMQCENSPSFALYKTANNQCLSPEGWQSAEVYLKPIAFDCDNTTLRMSVDSRVVDFLDSLDTYKILVRDGHHQPKTFTLIIEELLLSSMSGGQGVGVKAPPPPPPAPEPEPEPVKEEIPPPPPPPVYPEIELDKKEEPPKKSKAWIVVLCTLLLLTLLGVGIWFLLQNEAVRDFLKDVPIIGELFEDESAETSADESTESDSNSVGGLLSDLLEDIPFIGDMFADEATEENTEEVIDEIVEENIVEEAPEEIGEEIIIEEDIDISKGKPESETEQDVFVEPENVEPENNDELTGKDKVGQGQEAPTAPQEPVRDSGHDRGQAGDSSSSSAGSSTTHIQVEAPMDIARRILRDGGAGNISLESASSLQEDMQSDSTLQNDVNAQDAVFLLLEDAANKGEFDAMSALANYYDPSSETARGSILPDAEQAYHWYSQAAAAGDIEAQENLERLQTWLEDAASSGDNAARQLLNRWD